MNTKDSIVLLPRDEIIMDYFVTKQHADKIQSFLMTLFTAEMHTPVEEGLFE